MVFSQKLATNNFGFKFLFLLKLSQHYLATFFQEDLGPQGF